MHIMKNKMVKWINEKEKNVYLIESLSINIISECLILCIELSKKINSPATKKVATFVPAHTLLRGSERYDAFRCEICAIYITIFYVPSGRNINADHYVSSCFIMSELGVAWWHQNVIEFIIE